LEESDDYEDEEVDSNEFENNDVDDEDYEEEVKKNQLDEDEDYEEEDDYEKVNKKNLMKRKFEEVQGEDKKLKQIKTPMRSRVARKNRLKNKNFLF
jgi:hypothetical protein